MASFEIQGGFSLKGELTAQGAKNEALQIISACLLTPEKVTITNIPEILDVIRLIELLEKMGVTVTKTGAGKYEFIADNVDPEFLLTSDFRTRAAGLRGSVMIIGPILARFGKAYAETRRRQDRPPPPGYPFFRIHEAGSQIRI